MTVSGTNFGRAAGDYGTFRAGFPESIFDRLAEFDVGLPGQAVIDFKVSTGYVPLSNECSRCTPSRVRNSCGEGCLE